MHETVDEHFVEGILRNNNELAEHNRSHFNSMGALAINLMSAPGAGKTSILQQTIPQLASDFKSVVIEGDMVGELDVERLKACGITAHQISTGRSCHLDARMVDRLLHYIELPDALDFVFIENVGNLVCPAEFPLGEHKRVVLLSVTEGADKPLKYPVIFRNCDAVLFTKCDLLEYVDFDLESATRYVHDLNQECAVFSISIKQPDSLAPWFKWLKRELQHQRASQHCNGSAV